MRRLIYWLLNINWEHYKSASCFPRHCFCEAIGNGVVRQPIDAYSNIVYVLAGLFILISLFRTRKDRNPYPKTSDLPRTILIIFGLATIAIGIGSFLYHASFTFIGMEMDDDSMYLVASFLLLFSLSYFKDITRKMFIFYYPFINIILALIIYLLPAIRGDLFAFIIMIVLYTLQKAIKKKIVFGNLRYLVISVGLFLLGYMFWIPDYKKIYCHPNGLFQGHALWHVFSAISIVYMYFYMDSEYLPQ
jgi:hypothetical protein